MKWFDRVFASDIDPWMFPMVIERLRGTPARVEDLVRGVPQEVLVAHPGDVWSIQENVGHLLDLEELHHGRIDDFLAGAERLRPADVTNAKTYAAGHDEKDIGDLLAALRRERTELVRRFEEAHAAIGDTVSQHPRLDQPMRLVDLAYFLAEHDDAHLAEITRLAAPPDG